MSLTNYCANCEARDRPTHYEGGTVCRTCCLFTDLHVATHYIRARQPGMLTILDGALAEARTLAHRIMDHDDQRGNVAGAPNLYQPPERAMLPIEGGSRHMGTRPPEERAPRAIADQGAHQHRDQENLHGSQGSKASGQDTEASHSKQSAASRSNPYQPKVGAQAITNPYSLDDQRKVGNAMATAAHAIREAARALVEGRGYEPEPPLFELDTHRAKASPGTLHIANPALSDRQEQSEELID